MLAQVPIVWLREWGASLAYILHDFVREMSVEACRAARAPSSSALSSNAARIARVWGWGFQSRSELSRRTVARSLCATYQAWAASSRSTYPACIADVCLSGARRPRYRPTTRSTSQSSIAAMS